MGKFRILWDNKFDLATLLASSEAAGFPVENIQHDWFLKHWEATGLTAETVDANLGDLFNVKAFFAYYHNIRETASFSIQADDDPAYGSLGVDDAIVITPDMVAYDLIGKFWTSAQAFQYWRQLITDADTGHPDGFIREGRAFLGDYFEPAYNVTEMPDVTDVDPSGQIESLGGQKQANILTPYQRIVYKWEMLPESDVTILKQIFILAGRIKPIWICEDSDDPITKTRYVRAVTDWKYTPKTHGWYAVQVEVETER